MPMTVSGWLRHRSKCWCHRLGGGGREQRESTGTHQNSEALVGGILVTRKRWYLHGMQAKFLKALHNVSITDKKNRGQLPEP